MSLEIEQLFETMPQVGVVRWIGLRPERRSEIEQVESASIDLDSGLIGDHFNGQPGAKRQVTLIQQEHLVAVASILGCGEIDPSLVRRNIVVSGINLQALKDRRVRIGESILQITGNCPPCSRMEENLGPGGYNAMRGHGGVTARVADPGEVSIGDRVEMVPGRNAEI